MKRAIAPLLVTVLLTLAACGTAPGAPVSSEPGSRHSDRVPGTDPPPVVDGPPVVHGPPVVAAPPVDAPRQRPPVAASDPVGEPAPVPVQSPPDVRWYSPGIGLPLTSDDEAAGGKKVVMLTFDDGPSNSGTTAAILDTLAAQGVKAMFFVTGKALQHQELVERIHREGHVLAPHSMSHPNMTTLTEQQMRAEIDPLVDLITDVTGQPPKYFRPPYGAYNDTLLALLDVYGMQLINWTNGSLDWEGEHNGYKDPQRVVDDVMRQLHPGAVVLFHDTKRHTAEALSEVIRRIKAEGYQFVVLR